MEIREQISDRKEPLQALDPNCPEEDSSSDHCVTFTFKSPLHFVSLNTHPTDHRHLPSLCV